jgi:hypothetical protein
MTKKTVLYFTSPATRKKRSVSVNMRDRSFRFDKIETGPFFLFVFLFLFNAKFHNKSS